MIAHCVRCGAVVTILVAALTCDGLRGDEPAQASLAAKVDELFARWNHSDSPGCAVGIIQRGELIYSKGFGSANLEYQVPNTPRTMFEIMSFSKTFTCACVAMLMDDGKLSPDDELRKFIPEMHAFDPPIRIRDMICCKSGVWDTVSAPVLLGCENAPLQVPHRETDIFTLLLGQKTLPFPSGSQHRYSSGDYYLLGLIVKRITGQSLAQFAAEHIFRPVGMQRTFIEEDPTRVVAERAVGHWKPKGDDWRLWRPTAYWAGGASVNTCVEDLYRWDQAFTSDRLPRGKYVHVLFTEGTLLGNRYCLDTDAAVKAANPAAAADAPTGQYRGLKRRQFTGGAWGMTSAMTQFPDQQFTIICLSNSDDLIAWTMNRKIADIYLSDQLQPPTSRPTMRPASELPTFELSEDQLRDKVGAFRVKPHGVIWTIAKRGAGLELTDYLGAKIPLRPLSATRFDPEGPQFYATTHFVFTPSADGSPPALTTEWDEPENPGTLEFDRVELVSPTPNELEAYAGDYLSEELAAIYRCEVRDGQLWLRINSRRWERLDPTVRDEFVPHIREPADGRNLTFVRDDKGNVTGLAADYYRVSGVRFAKKK